MDKVRVYELAKELNTTSKRLMEKLAEINIIVKNHMSLLEEHELEALYDHIGVIRHKEGKAEEDDKKKVQAAPSSPKVEPNKDKKKDIKSAPRIIRTTEIFLDSKDEDAGKVGAGKERERASGRDAGHRRDIVKVTDASSGLRAGFVRDTRPDYMREIKPYVKMPDTKFSGKKDMEKGQQHQKQESIPDQKSEQVVVEKPQITQETKQDTVEEKKLPIDKVETAEKPEKTDKTVNDKTITQEPRKNVSHPAPGHVSAGEHKREAHGEESRSRPKKEKERKNAIEHPSKSEVFRKHGQKAEEKRIQAPKPAQKFIEIPKPDPSLVLHKEEASLQRGEARREYLNREAAKDMKRELKKDIQKGQIAEKPKKFKPQSIVLSQKKGLSEVLSEDFILDEFYSDNEVVRARKATKLKKESKEKQDKAKATLVSIKLPESITVKNLAEAMKKTSTEIIKKLMSLGVMATINQEIDFDTAAIVADEFGIKAEKEIVVNEEDILFDDSEGDESELVPRPPVVVVMGHVDHGKTSLLDAIRKTNVIDSEAGGITQHIGAYTVRINDRNITFLDTPGHEAFTAMRARGAQVTDIAILVIAADDGVMPQTVEAINHAKAAKVAIIVAINKIDKPDANPDRVKQQLTEYGLVPEEWGGDVICVPVSAKKGENIDHLLEMILLTADMLELKANPNKQAKGTVIEAKLDKNRGPIATLLVQRGTLNVGDTIVTGTTVGRIRAMVDDKGNNIKQAGPSVPIEILGLPEVPEAGEIFYAVTDEKVAKQLAEKRKLKQKEQQMKSDVKVSLDELFKQINEGKIKELNIIVKADVQGSVEAVKQSLEKLSNDEVKINIIHDGVGAITESDVTLAEVANAIIIGFNVRPGANVIEMAHSANVDIRLYRIIYDAIEDVQAAMKGMLEPKTREVVIGHAEIRQLFKVSGIGTVGGCYVTDGKISRNSDVRVVRNGIVIHEGKLASLKRFKDDVREVMQGFECGLSIEKFNDIKEGDIVEAYIMEQVAG